MAELSQVELNNVTYDLKDTLARRSRDPDPLDTRTYTNVIASANSHNGGAFFYLRVRANSYTDSYWHVITKVKASIPGKIDYYTDTIFTIYGYKNTYSWYCCENRIRSTSYRPIYYNSHFRVSELGYTNGCSNWIGFSLYNSTNPTDTNYKRQIDVELWEYENCTVELQNSLITPTNIPNLAAHSDWYTSSGSSFDNFNASSVGIKQSGDDNTTSISNLFVANGDYIADSYIGRYELLFQKDENTLTPLNNSNNVTATTKTMLTDVEFDPFGRIYYYNNTTVVNAGGTVGAGGLFWSQGAIDLRYSFNCSGSTLTAKKPVYLVVTPLSNGRCKIASADPLAQELPTTADGKWYIMLGRTLGTTYQMGFHSEHPVYCFNGVEAVQLSPGTTYNSSASIPWAIVDSTSTATAFTATVPNVLALKNGTTVILMNNKITSASNCTLNINNLGAKPIYMTNAAATRVTTQFQVNKTWMFVYNETRVSGGCWDLVYLYSAAILG